MNNLVCVALCYSRNDSKHVLPELIEAHFHSFYGLPLANYAGSVLTIAGQPVEIGTPTILEKESSSVFVDSSACEFDYTWVVHVPENCSLSQ